MFLPFNKTAMYCGTCVATSQPRLICVFIFSWWPLKFHKLISRKFPGQFKDIHDGVATLLLIRWICSLGQLRRQAIHVLFVFLSLKYAAM